jgi:hypothetical protein
MKPALLIIVLLLFTRINSFGQGDTIQARIVLIGDAGSLQNGRHPVVSAVKKNVKLDSLTTILFLGDNLYTWGLPDDAFSNYIVSKSILDSQAAIAANTSAKVYFMPGNHDWAREGPDGWAAIIRQENYIDQLGHKNVQYYPKGGCPGPVEIPLTKDIVLVIFDSQWWLHEYDKPGIESDCDCKTEDEVLNRLEDIVNRNSKKLILFACHHPFKSFGPHGGYFTWKQHIFPLTEVKPNLYIPLPIIGSIYPITRSVFGTPQDLHHPVYANMIRDLSTVLKQHSNVIFISGHDHDLQLIKDSSYYYIVSGAGTNKTRVSKNKKELFGAAENGFATLEVSKNKNVRVDFYIVKGDSVRKAYDSSLINFSKLPEDKKDTIKKSAIVVPFKDSIVVAIDTTYNEARSLHRFVLGNNYRKEWATPVDLKVFNINKQNGGFKIKSLGGGRQTLSLQLEDKKGNEWALRTINKNPEKAIPVAFRGTIASDMVQDVISAQHPYAPMVIPDLAKAINIVEATPTYYFVPDDTAFGIYREKFANTICLLERREPTPDNSDTKSTQTVITHLLEDNDDRIDQQEVLRARLLDMYIGDWDRHYNQWRWGTADTGKGKIYYAIPRDRDMAFFYSNGLLIKLVSQQLLPFLRGFKKNIPAVNWLNWSARDFDRIFLNRLDKNVWKETVADFQKDITDSVIKNAVKKFPPPIYTLDSARITKKLISRRTAIGKDALKYYSFLSKRVNVVGSNKKEYFKVSGDGDKLNVKVYKRKRDLDSVSLMYNRTFDPHDTKEIRLYGLNDDDFFDIDSNAHSKILVRIIGGKGNDTFNINGHVHNDIYDLNTKENYIIHHNYSKIKTSSNPHVNDYNYTYFKYNTYRFPRLELGYNPDDKLMVGLGFAMHTYGFRKDPYATQQKISTLYALNDGAYQIKYFGEFNELIGKNDIVVNAEYFNPVLNNFFGLGNETIKDPTKSLDYYRVRYKYSEVNVQLRNRFNPILSVMLGPTVAHYWNRYADNENKILGKPSLIGLDSADVYSNKTYAGATLSILVNNLDNVLLPTRGIDWNTEFTALGGLSQTSRPFTKLTSDMAVHAALSDPAKVVAVLRLGGGHIFSKHYEYFQALNIGENNFLRGFRKDRFSGNSLAYGSFELRVKLFDVKSYVMPGSFGIIGFDDVGRVWMENENSKKWHNAYGTGLYFTPYEYVLVSATVAFSKEENLFNFSIGTKFNITF